MTAISDHQCDPCIQKLVTEADIEVVGSARPQNITFKDSGRIVETQLKQSFQVIFIGFLVWYLD